MFHLFFADWPAYTPDTTGPREDIWPSTVRQNSSNSGPFDVSGGSPLKQSVGSTDCTNKRAINHNVLALEQDPDLDLEQGTHQ